MRRIARVWVSLIVVAGLAPSASGQGAAPPPRRQAVPAAAPARGPANAKVPTAAEAAAKRREMETLLGLWEQQSARLTSLTVSFIRIDTSPVWNEKIEFKGNAYLQSPGLACLHFQKLTVDPAKPAAPNYVDNERIVCTGTDVLQYDYVTKQIFRFPLNKQDRQRALEEGPLPFLFNMKAAEAKARYTMDLIDQDDKTYLISVLPMLNEDKEVFSSALLLLNKKTFLPDRLVLQSPNQKDNQDYRFSQVLPNQAIDAKYFQANLTIKGWKLVDNPAPRKEVLQNGAAAVTRELAPRHRMGRGDSTKRTQAAPR